MLHVWILRILQKQANQLVKKLLIPKHTSATSPWILSFTTFLRPLAARLLQIMH